MRFDAGGMVTLPTTMPPVKAAMKGRLGQCEGAGITSEASGGLHPGQGSPASLCNTDGAGIASCLPMRSPYLCLPGFTRANLPRLHLVHGTQDQIASAVDPMLKPWVFVDNEIVSAFFESD